MRNKKKYSDNNTAGFTLVELVITLAISLLIMAAVYSAYTAQQGTYLAQDQVAKMQQNLRAAMMIMGNDIKMAGYEPGYDGTAARQFGVVSATDSTFVFTADLDDSGGAPGGGETFTYQVYNTGAGISALRRIAGQSAVANHIEAIEFQYLDAAGVVLATPVSAADLLNIRAVEVSILARAAEPDRKFTNTMAYTPASGTPWPAANDNFRRRLLITTINCRNLGL